MRMNVAPRAVATILWPWENQARSKDRQAEHEMERNRVLNDILQIVLLTGNLFHLS